MIEACKFFFSNPCFLVRLINPFWVAQECVPCPLHFITSKQGLHSAVLQLTVVRREKVLSSGMSSWLPANFWSPTACVCVGIKLLLLLSFRYARQFNAPVWKSEETVRGVRCHYMLLLWFREDAWALRFQRLC